MFLPLWLVSPRNHASSFLDRKNESVYNLVQKQNPSSGERSMVVQQYLTSLCVAHRTISGTADNSLDLMSVSKEKVGSHLSATECTGFGF